MARTPSPKLLLRIGISIAVLGTGIAMLGFVGGHLWSYWRIDQEPVPTPADLSQGSNFATAALQIGVLFGGLGAMLIAFSLGLRERRDSETHNLRA